MAEEIIFKVDVDVSDGAKSLKTLKQEFKSAQQELDGAVVGSEKYYSILRKIGDLKGDMGDLNATMNAFDGENKMNALTGAIGGVASGFQAAVGATALFGSESEDLNKVLLKVQATMAFTEGIKGVMAMGETFKVLNAVIAANPFVAIATAIVVAIGAISVAVNGLNEEEKELDKEREQRHQDQLDRLQKEHDVATKFTMELMKARGASEEEIYLAEKERIKQSLSENRLLLLGNSRHAEEYYKVKDELTKELILLEANHARVVREEEEKKRDEINKTTNAKKDSLVNEQKLIDDLQAIYDKEDAQREYNRKNKQAKIDAEDKERRDKAQQDALDKAEFEATLRAEQDEADKINKDKRIAYEQEVRMAEQDSWMASQALAEGVFATKLSNAKKGSKEEQKLLKQQFELNKKFQLAQAIMNGYQAVQAIMATAVDPTGITTAIRIGAAITTSAANIAKIAATKFESATPTTPDTGGGIAQTNTNTGGSTTGVQIAQPNATLLNPDGTIKGQEQTQQINKVYVVESEITGVQAKVSQFKKQATFS